jgi:hypothetical protein
MNHTKAVNRNIVEHHYTAGLLVKSTPPHFGFQIILNNNTEKNVPTQLATTLTIFFYASANRVLGIYRQQAITPN